MKNRIVCLLTLLGSVWPMSSIEAHTGDIRLLCMPREMLLQNLLGKYEEQPIANGLTNGGVLTEMLQSEGGQNWTLILSWPDGQSCLLAAGKDRQGRESPPVKGGEL